MLLSDLLRELTLEWSGNEVRILDEQGNVYRPVIVESEEDVTYIKIELA